MYKVKIFKYDGSEVDTEKYDNIHEAKFLFDLVKLSDNVACVQIENSDGEILEIFNKINY